MYIQFTVFSINFLVMVKKNDSFSVLVFLKVVFFACGRQRKIIITSTDNNEFFVWCLVLRLLRALRLVEKALNNSCA